MKKWFVVLAVMLLMVFAVSASAEVDHSMISMVDENFYCWLANVDDENYVMSYSCLMTNTDTTGGASVQLHIGIIDADGQEIFSLGDMLFYIKAGETKAIYLFRGDVPPAVREQAKKYELVCVACDRYSEDVYADISKYYTPLPVNNLLVNLETYKEGPLHHTVIDYGKLSYSGEFKNPFDSILRASDVRAQIELYDKEGHLVYCGPAGGFGSGNTYEYKPSMLCGFIGSAKIPDLIGKNCNNTSIKYVYDVKLTLVHVNND